MKTMKYRSIVSALGLALLSVFLFTTSCEKESDSVPGKKSKFTKFKALHFTGEVSSTSTTSSAGSGTFTGNGSSDITFTPGGISENSEFSSPSSEGPSFTDPKSNDDSFVINSIFNFLSGGGSVRLGSDNYNIAFGFCLSSDIFGMTDAPSDEKLDAFIGVAGDFDPYDFEGDLDNPLGLILYVFSYNGGTRIGSFESFSNENVDKNAYILAARFKNNSKGEGSVDDIDLFFATSGNVHFNGANVSASNVKMKKLNENEDGLEGQTVNLSASLECGTFGSFFFEFDSDD